MINKIKEVPLLPLRGLIVFPSMVLHLDVGRDKSIAALERAMLDDQEVFLAAQKKTSIDEPKIEDIYSVGTLVRVKQMLKLPNGTLRVLVEGIARYEIVRILEEEKEFLVEIEKLEEIHEDQTEEEALMRTLLKQFEQFTKLSRKISRETFKSVSDMDNPSRVADIISSHLPIKLKEKQTLLEMTNVTQRLHHIINIITNEKGVGY